MSTTNIRIRYEVLDKELKEARAEILKLTKTTDSLEKNNKELADSFKRLNNQAKQTNNNFSGLTKNFKSLAGALGVASGVLLLANALKDAAKTVVNFQKQNAILAGVLDTNLKGVSRLTDSARQLGATTAKTASQVTQLQIALARLGFKEQDIIDLTPALINGSIALNAELDQTAELVGAIVKTFDAFDAIDAPDIVDQLTVATQNSALSFDKLQTSIPIVAGAAEQAGIPLNRLLALLGKLADAGIDTSTSATALRNIFIQSAGKGLEYTEILENISTSTDKLTASTDAFGVRAAVSAGVISKQLEGVDKLEASISKAGGTAQRVADTQLQTLNGRLDLLSSAYEGFILSIEQGDGALAQFANKSIEGLTALLDLLTPKVRQSAKLTKEQTEEFKKLAEAASLVDSEFARIKYDQLTKENETLKESIKGVKDEIEDNKLQLQGASNDEIPLFQFDIKRLKDKLTELELQLVKNEFRLGGFAKALKETIKIEEEEIGLLPKLKKELQEEVELREKATSVNEIQLRTERIEAIKEEIRQLTTLAEKLQTVTQLQAKGFGTQLEESTKNSLDKVGKSIEIFSDKITLDREKRDKKEEEDLLKKEQLKEQLLVNSFEQASELSDRLFQIRINNINREQQSLELQKQYELSLAGDNAEGIAAIEAKFAKKSSELRQKAAKDEKTAALFSIAINTARGIVAALTSVPPNIPLSIAIGVTGGIQAGVVASKNIPKFAEGGEIKGNSHARGGVLLEAEGGEFIMRKDAVKKIGLQNLDLMNRKGEVPNTIVNVDTKELVNELKRRPEVSLNWNEKGFTSYLRNKNTIVARKHKKYAV